MLALANRTCWSVLAAVVLLLPSSLSLAQDFVFASTFADGLAQVVQTDKLLVVIQATGDFTETAFTLPAATAFKQLTLHDPRIARGSRERCVFVCQQISSPALLAPRSRRNRESDARPVDNVAIYFCSPEGNVLHFLVGFVGADEFLSALDWSERICRESRLKTQPAEQREVIANWHRLRIADVRSIAAMPKPSAKQSSSENGEAAAGELRSLVSAAWEVRGRQLLARFGDNFPEKERAALLNELSMHGEPRTDFPHLVLARQPMIPLSRLQRSVAEICLGSEFWEISPRRAELVVWSSDRQRQRQPVLLVIHPNTEGEQLVGRKLTERSWQPRSEQLAAMIGQFTLAEMTTSELVTLWRDRQLDLRSLSTTVPRYVVVDGAGGVTAVLDEKSEESAIARALSQATSTPFAAGRDTKPRASPEINP